MTREAWARGRNYDVDLLRITWATPGFILGEAIIGESLLGDRGTDIDLELDFTSITINEPTTVQNGLFVHREMASCTVTATLPEMVEFEGRFMRIEYDGIELFAGRVTEPVWTETVDVDRGYLPGNTPVKTYRVTLPILTGEEVLATASAQLDRYAWWDLSGGIVDRVELLTGYPVTVLPAADDLPLAIWNQDWDDEHGPTVWALLVYDDTNRQSMLETLRREAAAGGYVVRYQPRADDQVVLQPVNRWLSGDNAAEALLFSDEDLGPLAVDSGDAFLTVDRRVSYTSRQISRDKSLFTDSISVRFETDDSGSNTWTEFTYGPMRVNDAAPEDLVVDYGRVKFGSSETSKEYRLARAIAQTLPLKRRSAAFTSTLTTPLQSTKQLEGTVPGMALLTSDEVTTRVAVLGRTHTITPDRWLVGYTMGPEHLLTRTSDREPAPALVDSPVVAAGVSTTFRWTVPDLPTDVSWYEVVFKSPTNLDGVRWYTSTVTEYAPTRVEPAPAAGTARTYVKTGGVSGDYWFVAYTSNPDPGTTNTGSVVWREGQPAVLGQQSH